MPYTKSHVQKKERRYSGEDEAANLLDWLDLGVWGGKPAVRRPRGYSNVLRILELWRELRDAWERAQRVEQGEVVAVSYSRDPSYNDKLEELQRLLFAYKYYPMIFPFGAWNSVSWFPAKGGFRKNRHGWPASYNESNAVFDIVQLAEMELLGRVNQCVCGTWFFGRFGHQRFCSAKCRETSVHSSEGWKEYRRRKAREYYLLHKSGKVR